MNPQEPTPQGSLEELFRHHLLESEAAAVAPRPFVWEQVENNLLLQENQRYRRRLVGYRWAMAASLLLTLLAGAGWLHTQLGRPSLAAGGPSGRAPASDAPEALGRIGYQSGLFGATSAYNSLFSTSTLPAIGQTFTLSPLFASGYPSVFLFDTSRPVAGVHASQRAGTSPTAAGAAGYAALPAATGLPGLAGEFPTGALLPALLEPTAEVGASGADDQLGMRLASLRVPGAAALPEQLAGRQWHFQELPRPTSPWKLQVAYAAGLYDPNIDFTKAADSYDATLGPGTVATTREAAAEYRSNLRLGLSQRLSLWASRRLGNGRWNLRTGLELSQNEAESASSVGFVGEQVATNPTYLQVLPNRLSGTTFRYRAVSVPVEAAYTHPLRRNLSLYGRAGALVSGLLHVRSEVTGNPEATRDYNIQSADSPYRHLLLSARAGAGLHYQPRQQSWALTVGPVAEMGMMSLNIDPTQPLLNQHRPYSVGLEAGVEFGSWLRPAPPVQP